MSDPKIKRIPTTLTLTALWIAGTASGLWAAPVTKTTVVALSGDAAPGGNGIISTFSAGPVFNDAGQMAFLGHLIGTIAPDSDGSGIFRGDGGPLTQIARAGQTAPDGNGSFRSFVGLTLNDVGQVAFRGALTGTGAPEGIYRGDGGPVTQVVRVGQAAPGGNGTFSGFFGYPALNDAGQVAIGGYLTGTIGGSNNDAGLYRGDGGPMTQIARKGQTAPDGNGSFFIFDNVLLNDAGQVAFEARFINTIGGSSDDQGIFRGDGGTLTQVARKGQTAPDGNGTFSGVGGNAVLNDSGQVAFLASLTGTSAPEGIFRGDGGTLTQVARKGQTAPDGNGTFSGFTAQPALNDAGQVAFQALLTDTIGGSSDGWGIFRGDGGTSTQIARPGQAAPDGNGTFTGFGSPTLNDAGQVAFSAGLTGTIGGSSDDSGIFLFDDVLGLVQVARKRESFLGRLIISLAFNSFSADSSGLNEPGQVAYWFKLADGYEGIAVWTVVPPGDYNGNGVADAADYVMWRDTLGQSVAIGAGADGDQSGVIDTGDYALWKARFGSAAAAGSGSLVEVPEPSSLLLAVLCVAAVLVLGRNFRRDRPAGYM